MEKYSYLNCVFRESNEKFEIESFINKRATASSSIDHSEIKILADTWEKAAIGRISSNRFSKYEDSLNTQDIELGNNLVRILLPTEKIQYLDSVIKTNQETLIISINTNNDSISNLPWEVCAYADWNKLGIKFLPKVVVVRSTHTDNIEWNIAEPVKFLVVGSSPNNKPIVNFKRELTTISDRLNNSFKNKSKQKFKLVNENGIDFVKLKQKMARERPHVLHIIGHGGKGLFEIEDVNGNASLIDGKDLSVAISKGKGCLSLLFISACLTMKPSKRKKLSGLGTSLSNIVPVVVGMGLPISEEMTIKFVDNFYYSLTSSQSIIESFIYARDKVKEERPQSPEWIAPILIQNPPGSQNILFQEDNLFIFISDITDKIALVQDRLADDLYSLKGWQDLLSIFKIIDKDLLRQNKRKILNLTATQEGKIVNNLKPTFIEVRGRVNEIIRLLEKNNKNPELEFRYNLSPKTSETQGQLDEMIEKLLELKDEI